MFAEQQTEWIINNNLVNKGWCIDSDDTFKNVFFQKPPYPDQQKKLKGNKPDYILYQSGTKRPIAIIEAKKGGVNLEPALQQGTEYANALNVSLVFAMNGAYCETLFIPNGKTLVLNGEEVRELLREKEALEFLNANSNEAWTIPPEVKVSRDELITQFRNSNDILRAEGLRAGIERFSEFANILFLKLLSENNSKSWWESIKTQSNDDLIGYVNQYVIGQIRDQYGGDVFTPLSIKNPKALRHIIDAIDPLSLSTIDMDIKGDAFEYFLEKTTSTNNDLGEYFTPRNIVKTTINLVDPKFGESIYDPFCGTGGFLTEAYNYIKENTIIEEDEDLKKLQTETLYGGEITTTARIAKMNMILHGDGHSGVRQIDSLANPQNAKYDIVVTNMPFSQKISRTIMANGRPVKENLISPLYYNGIAKNNGDAVCVLHCLRALRGGMALVVPEGFLFKKELAGIREFLLSKAKLQSVISLPQGTFLPYTAVKTSILYFTDAHKGVGQTHYWYFEASNIGVTLNNKKQKIKGLNDLNKIEASDIKNADNNKENMLEIGFDNVDIRKVRENDYNLIGKFYRDVVIGKKYKMVCLLDAISTLEIGSRPKGGVLNLKAGAISLGGGQIGSNGKLDLSKIPLVPMEFYNKIKKGFVADKDILICKDGALTGKVCIVEFNLFSQKEIMINEHVYILRGNCNVIIQDFLFYCLKSCGVQKQVKNLAYNKSAQPGLNRQHIKKIKIPLPSIHEQKDIIRLIQQKEAATKILEQKIVENKQDVNHQINLFWE